jgi:DNA-binding response OmpR family regulator
MNQSSHIHIVDDDPEICSLVEEYLVDEGFRVTTAGDAAQMRSVLADEPADLVILDVRLPGESGLDIAMELRRSTDIPIIMLSEKDDVVDRVAGLELGADDYVPKPFHLRELLARIRSLLRRREQDAEPAGEATEACDGDDARLRFSGWVLNVRRRELLSPDGAIVDLSAGEFNLLAALAQRPNRVLSRDQLLDIVYNREANLFDRSIDVQVGRLRRKIESDPKRPSLIKTVRGAGYMFNTSVDAD